MTEESRANTSAAPRGIRSFVARNRDDLVLEAVGGLLLALVVSVVMFTLEEVRSASREAHAESLSNSIFVRQAVMSNAEVLPFSGLYLVGTQLSGLDLAGADFSDANLSSGELKDVDLTGASLSEADLHGADLAGSVLVGADLSEANFTDVELTGVDLTGADLTDTELAGAFYVASDPPTVDSTVLESLDARGDADADDD